MADNVPITPGSGAQIATDDVGGVHYQRVKLDIGGDGAESAVTLANPLPVKTTALGQTWFVCADAVALAANKWHLSVWNGSSNVVKLRKLFLVNVQTTAVTGVAVRLSMFTVTAAPTGGTLLTARPADSMNAALPGTLEIRTGATATGVSLLWPVIASCDEAGATQAFPSTHLLQFGNLMMEGNEVQEYTLRQNEGIGIRQVTSTVIGSWAWIAAFTIE